MSTLREMRAVVVPVGERPRIVDAAPSFLWRIIGGIPDHFTSFALSRYGRRFAAVWCRDVAIGLPNRFVTTPLFRYREFSGYLYGPLVITAADQKNGDALSLKEEELATCVGFASRWPRIRVDHDRSSEREM